MAVERANPYAQFNFLVDLEDFQAGFQEVSGLGMEVTLSEYRNGSDQDNSVRKITGMHKSTDITLKRGVIGALNLYNWFNAVRQGSQTQAKTVTIQLQNEEHQVVLTWKLTRARPTKYTGPSFNGKGSDLAIEELVLACERIDLE